jgi:hypothetical protein
MHETYFYLCLFQTFIYASDIFVSIFVSDFYLCMRHISIYVCFRLLSMYEPLSMYETHNAYDNSDSTNYFCNIVQQIQQEIKIQHNASTKRHYKLILQRRATTTTEN